MNYLSQIKKVLLLILFLGISHCFLSAQEATIWKRYNGEIGDTTIPLLPDYSYAGYKLGEEAIPENHKLKVFNVTNFGAIANDTISDQKAIQEAIHAAEKNKGGIVFFPPGEFLVNTDQKNTKPILIKSSNIILKGSGSTPGGTIINMKCHMNLPAGVNNWETPRMFMFGPRSISKIPVTKISKNAPRGSKCIYVDNVKSIIDVKYIQLRMKANTNANSYYLEDKTTREIWSKIVEQGVGLIEYHEIESVDIGNNAVYLKDPVIDDINASHFWDVLSVNLLEGCAFEDIHFKGNFAEPYIHHKDYIVDYAWHAVYMSRVAHSWIRRSRFSNVSLAAKYSHSYASSILTLLVDGNRGHALSSTDGGSTRTLQGLIWDNTSEGQFHGTDISAKTCGSVVWRVDAVNGMGWDVHASQPRTNLIDLYNSVDVTGAGGHYSNNPNHLTGLTIWNQNRVGEPISNVDFWRLCERNYCGCTIVNPIIVGYHGSPTSFLQKNIKYEESNGKKVVPESLYEAQLNHRLGLTPDWIIKAKNEYLRLKTEWYTVK